MAQATPLGAAMAAPAGNPFAQPGPQQVAPAGTNPAPPGMPQGMPPASAPFQPSPFVDLSVTLPPHWQLIDMSTRNIRSALNTGGFRTTPKVAAAIREVEATLTRLISAYSASAGKAGNSPASPADAERGAPGDSSPVSDANADDESAT